MKIKDETPTFKKQFKILDFSRSAILMPLFDRIKNAKSIGDLKNISSCDLGINAFFIYNGVGKLYFLYHAEKEPAVTLMKFAFANHEF